VPFGDLYLGQDAPLWSTGSTEELAANDTQNASNLKPRSAALSRLLKDGQGLIPDRDSTHIPLRSLFAIPTRSSCRGTGNAYRIQGEYRLETGYDTLISYRARNTKVSKCAWGILQLCMAPSHGRGVILEKFPAKM